MELEDLERVSESVELEGDRFRLSKRRRKYPGDAVPEGASQRRREAQASAPLARLPALFLAHSPSTTTKTEVSSRMPRALIAFCTMRSAASDGDLECRTCAATCAAR